MGRLRIVRILLVVALGACPVGVTCSHPLQARWIVKTKGDSVPELPGLKHVTDFGIGKLQLYRFDKDTLAHLLEVEEGVTNPTEEAIHHKGLQKLQLHKDSDLIHFAEPDATAVLKSDNQRTLQNSSPSRLPTVSPAIPAGTGKSPLPTPSPVASPIQSSPSQVSGGNSSTLTPPASPVQLLASSTTPSATACPPYSVDAPNDCLLGQEQNMMKISVLDAWQLTTGSSSVKVCIIDSGVNCNHPDLAANCNANDAIDYTNTGFARNPVKARGTAVTDNFWHGTHVAGIVGAVRNNAFGISGVSQQVKIMGCKAFNNFSGTVSAIVNCINYCRVKGYLIQSHAYTVPNGNVQGLKTAIEALAKAGGMVIGSAGNENRDIDASSTSLLFPIGFAFSNPAYDTLVSVTATDEFDNLRVGSTWGRMSVDLGAPGNNILSTSQNLTQLWSTHSGSSMAVGHVAGAAALIRAKYPTLPAWCIKDAMVKSVDKLPSLANKVKSEGRLDVAAALAAAAQPCTPPAPPSPSPSPSPAARPACCGWATSRSGRKYCWRFCTSTTGKRLS